MDRVDNMDRKRRRESGGSSRSCESMSVSSLGDPVSGDEELSESALQIVTNSSFFEGEKKKNSNTHISPEQFSNWESTLSPVSSISISPFYSHSGEQNIPSVYISPEIAESIAIMLKILGLSNGEWQNKGDTVWFQQLCLLIKSFLERTPPVHLGHYQEKLKRHLYIKDNGEVFVDLKAAHMLKLHPDMLEKHLKKGDYDPNYLPSLIKDKLMYGMFVPIRHIIYGEALKDGTVHHFKGGRVVDTEPYPLSLTRESPPMDFVSNIRRPDLIRSVTTHSVTLGCRFPLIASNMHSLIRELWSFLYQEMMDVQVVMEVYDEYFREFERQLGLLTLMPMEGFPKHIVDYVKAKYKSTNTTQ